LIFLDILYRLYRLYKITFYNVVNHTKDSGGTIFEKIHYYLVSKNLQYSILLNDMSSDNIKPGKIHE